VAGVKTDWLRSIAKIVSMRRLKRQKIGVSIRHRAETHAKDHVCFGQARTDFVQ